MKRFTAKPDIASPRGISVIEVLISMGILAIGLLGVAAMFPVGSHYMERGDEYDRADAVAEAALNDAVTTGLLDPKNWLMSRAEQTIGRHVIEVSDYIDTVRVAAVQDDSLTDIERVIYLNQELGSVFIVDPAGVASGMATPLKSSSAQPYSTSQQVGLFPASVRGTGLSIPSGWSGVGDWGPWSNMWPIRRVTTTGPSLAQFGVRIFPVPGTARPGQPTSVIRTLKTPIEFDAARQITFATDDLSVELGDDADLPSQMIADEIILPNATNSSPTSVGFLNKGSYSYFLSVVPTSTQARNDLANTSASSSYDISAIVSKGRSLAEPYSPAIPSDELRGALQLAIGERICGGKVVSTATSGGEISLYEFPGGSGRSGHEVSQLANFDDQPWEELRAGGWVMVVGPHPQSVPTHPMLFAQWYRVVATDESPAINLPTIQNEEPGPTLALRGPDWPWQPSTDSTAPSNDLRVIIVPSAVAVHTRTMQLSAGASWAPQ